MGKSFEEVEKIQECYIKEYFEPPVNSVGISNIKVQKEVRGRKITLKEGESLDDLCLSVGFEKAPPSHAQYPSEYKDVRVFYEVIGKIRAG